MEMAKFHTKIFKFQLVQRCFQLKGFILDKINHILQKFKHANNKCAFSLHNLIRIIVFCIKNFIMTQQSKFLLR
jgi:hypothetical protein